MSQKSPETLNSIHAAAEGPPDCTLVDSADGLESISAHEWNESIPVRQIIERGNQPDDRFQQSLRPQTLKEYIGQDAVKKNIQLALSAAKRRGEALDHVLLHGPPGLGKTTLAAVIATELGVGFKATSGPVLERPGDLAAILSGLEERDVLFIDEIHRLPRSVEEILYPALEDYHVDIIVGQGPAARSVQLGLARFTLVAATTRTGLLTAPLRDRFGIIERMDFYDQAALVSIVERSSVLLGIGIDRDGAEQIARRARGTPRIANRLLKRARDYSQEAGSETITGDLAAAALTMLDVDEAGLDKMDRLLLTTLIEKFAGGPVGVGTLAAAIQEERATVEDVYEPYLLQQGFLRRTPRGREATDRAFEHLKLNPNKTNSNRSQYDLFK